MSRKEKIACMIRRYNRRWSLKGLRRRKELRRSFTEEVIKSGEDVNYYVQLLKGTR